MKKDAYSPNAVLFTLVFAVSVIAFFSASSLWVSASRINNLQIRSVVLSMSQACASFSKQIGLDTFFPKLRNVFLENTKLNHHVAWDERYYNQQNYVQINQSASIPLAQNQIAQNQIVQSSKNFLHSETSEQNAIEQNQINDSLFSDTLTDATALDIQETSQPTKPFLSKENSTAVNSIHSKENPLKLFFFGDSQVFSLGSGLSRLTGKDSPIAVDFLAIHSSGFVRWDYYNWPAQLSDYFSTSPCDTAVMMLGMNDYQSFWNSNGEILKKGSPEWIAAYSEKCKKIIDQVLLYVPRLYWISMPVVRNAEYNASLALINKVHDDISASYSSDLLVRISLSDTFPGKEKPYADIVSLSNGSSLRVMSDDGSHYTVEGGMLVMQPLFNRLVKDFLFSELPVAKSF